MIPVRLRISGDGIKDDKNKSEQQNGTKCTWEDRLNYFCGHYSRIGILLTSTLRE